MRRIKSQARIDLAASVEALSKKYTAREIAEITGKTHAYIKSIAQDFGISFYVPKIDDQDKKLMKQLRETYGLTLAVIADKFEISVSAAARACAGTQKLRGQHERLS